MSQTVQRHGFHVSIEKCDKVRKAYCWTSVVLWRGCGPRCLDFLEDGDDAGTNDACRDTFEAGMGDEEDEFQFSDDE